MGAAHAGSPAEPEPPAEFAQSASTSTLRYLIEAVVVAGNHKTQEALIRRELGLAVGDVVTPSDARVESARLRLLALGFFLDVRLALSRGSRRGGAVLTVTVEERGSILLAGLYLGTSEATAFWGGLDVAETNLLGRGIVLEGGFVQSTQPTVPDARPGSAIRLRAAGPPAWSRTVSPSLTLLANHGSEFFTAFGAGSELDPQKRVALRSRRVEGTLGLGFALSSVAQVEATARFGAVRATYPHVRTRDLGGGRASAIDFEIDEGDSQIGSLGLILDVDSRSDPVLPRAGRRLLLSVEGATPAFASSYTFAKTVLQVSSFTPVGRAGHVIGVHGLLGAIVGRAPFFDQFFVADLNLLLPPRVLGLNFSTLPSHGALGDAITEHRYDDYAARLLVDYAVPLVRRRNGFIYRGDAFVAAGVFAMASAGDLRSRDRSFSSAVPIDLTADLGIRLDTYIGIFNLSVANVLGRVSY